MMLFTAEAVCQQLAGFMGESRVFGADPAIIAAVGGKDEAFVPNIVIESFDKLPDMHVLEIPDPLIPLSDEREFHGRIAAHQSYVNGLADVPLTQSTLWLRDDEGGAIRIVASATCSGVDIVFGPLARFIRDLDEEGDPR